MLNLPQNPQFCQTDVSGSTFVNADCFDVFPFIEDKSIDAIICDLPYGTTACKWDVIIPFDKLWEQYERIIKPNGAIVLFGSQPFTSALIMSKIDWFKYELIWNKVLGKNFLLAKKMPLKSHENILIFYKKQPVYNPQKTELKNIETLKREKRLIECADKSISEHYGRIKRVNSDGYYKYPVSIITEKQQNVSNQFAIKSNHPTQKPLELLEYLIKTYTNEGDTVLDNTMGSGTTILAAIKNNRIGIGIEKEKQYYDVAVRRASEYCH